MFALSSFLTAALGGGGGLNVSSSEAAGLESVNSLAEVAELRSGRSGGRNMLPRGTDSGAHFHSFPSPP